MSMQYCETCEKQIDLDTDVEHFDEHSDHDCHLESGGGCNHPSHRNQPELDDQEEE